MPSTTQPLEAVQWTGSNAEEVESFLGAIDPDNKFNLNFSFDDELEVWNYLGEEWVHCPFGSWVVVGDSSELYPLSETAFSKVRVKE